MSIFRFRANENAGQRSLPDGLYEDVVSEALDAQLTALSRDAEVSRAKLTDEDAVEHLAEAVHQATRIALDALGGKEASAKRLALANHLLSIVREHAAGALDSDEATLRPELLLHVVRANALQASGFVPRRPATPLTRSDLFVNAEQVGVLQELLSEIESADQIDLICAFIKWSGLLKFRDALARHCARGRPLRVLTTTYLGATDARAVEELARLGAQVKVAYEDVPTRLHAKAWLFHRDSGLPTAYIGSSNLSRQALTDGIEWNVRISAADVPHVIEKFDAVFRRYWEDSSSGFAPFRSAELDGQLLRESLARARFVRSGRDAEGGSASLHVLDVEPKDFQRTILNDLAVARARGSTRNLVVAATGTGKTVVAALDYRRLRREGLSGQKLDTILFVAHRERILEQSLETFRAALKEPTFGELLVGGRRPESGRHVFGSIQSLDGNIDAIPPEHFDVVIVDEVHHAAASTYRKLLGRLKPKVLVGLTATPERTDDSPGDALKLDDFFDRPWAAELRVWDAIDRQILVPFNYFGVDDGTDVRRAWKRGKYDATELANVYDANRIWVRRAAESVARYVRDAGAMRALAFCVSIGHAELTARELERQLGVRCVALTSRDDAKVRADLLQAFESESSDRPRVICTVDLFNEGVDLPRTDVLLLLRPTESATLFVQQIGRGLRRAEGKDSLTVLDFVGLQHENFRFETKYKALLGLGRRPMRDGFQHGFARLPAGCSLQLEEKPREQVLAALRRSLRLDDDDFATRLREGSATSLLNFLRDEDLEPTDFFRDERTWTAILQRAGRPVPEAVDDTERQALRSVQRLVHIDDPGRLALIDALLRGTEPLGGEASRRLARMIFGMLYGLERATDEERCVAMLRGHERLKLELRELLPVLRSRIDVTALQPPKAMPAIIPLHLHGRYRTEEVAAAFDLRTKDGKLYRPQVGTLDPHVAGAKLDLHLVTLDKSAKHKVPHLQYRDYAISPTLFHWQSQASTRRDSSSGRRHLAADTLAVLFVREVSKDDRGLGGAYRFLGTAKRVDDRGERPISITYRLLDGDLPGELLALSRAAVA